MDPASRRLGRPRPGGPGVTNYVRDTVKPLEYGVFVQGGFGVTEDRGGFKFMMVGAQGGKVLTPTVGPGLLRGNFEYDVQVIPFWQSYTPIMQRQNCLPVAGTNGQTVTCSAYFNVGGTYTGISITPPSSGGTSPAPADSPPGPRAPAASYGPTTSIPRTAAHPPTPQAP